MEKSLILLKLDVSLLNLLDGAAALKLQMVIVPWVRWSTLNTGMRHLPAWWFSWTRAKSSSYCFMILQEENKQYG